MNDNGRQDRWAEIEHQTTTLMEQIAHADAEELLILMERRQAELEAYFSELDYTDTQLQGLEEQIASLVSKDQEIMEACRQQQQELLQQSKQLRNIRSGVDAYTEQAAETVQYTG